MSKRKRAVSDYILLITGTFLMAFSINQFYETHHMVTGGVTGLAIIIRHGSEKWFGFPVPLWLSNIVLNAPLFVVGFKVFGIRRLGKTVFATILLSASLYAAAFIPVLETDMTLAAVFGGVCSGIGLGLVFRTQATTGGSDMLASIIHTKIRHISVSRIMFVIDAAVIALGFFVFSPITAMYAVIAVYITSKIIDTILEGLSFAKATFIISDHSQEIADRLMKELNRGVTGLEGKGMYTQKQKNVLFCVTSLKEIVKIKDIVASADQSAFFIVTDAREVLGEGFQMKSY